MDVMNNNTQDLKVDSMNTDNLLYGFIIVLIVIIVFEVCSFSNSRNNMKKSNVETFEKGWYQERGFWMPQHWLKPRLWYTAPKSYGNYYGEELLTCMDGCPGRKDKDDSLKYCKRMYPYFMGFDGPPHHGINALGTGPGNPDLHISI